MSTLTSRFSLIKPALSDPADITAFNGNWDTIDTNLGYADQFRPVVVTSGQNMNSLTTPTVYQCKTNTIAASLSNSPTTNAFNMVVLPHTDNGVTQLITEYPTSGARQFRRNLYNGTWGAWAEIPTMDALSGLSGKQDIITGAATTITSSNLTTNRAVISNGSGKIGVSATTSTELGYVHGVTSAIQTQLNNKQATLTGGATTIATSNLTANRTLVSNGSGKVATSTITSAELGYLAGLTGAIQPQINSKQNTITGAATTILSSNLATSRALVSNGNGKVDVSAITSTELSYLDNCTSNIQEQLNSKVNGFAPIRVSVPVGGWVKNNSTGAYEQSVTVSGLLTSDDKRTRVEMVGSTTIATHANFEKAFGCVNYVACNTNNKLYLRCDKSKPNVTFSVDVVIMR